MDEKAMERSSVSQQQAGPESGRRLRGFALFSVLGALMLTLLLEALDQTVVGTALPRIIGSLQGFDRYTWAVTAYTLASVIMIPTVGKLSDQFGRKWFLIAGTVIFLAGSALAGASQTMNELIAFRAMQGLGAGIGNAPGGRASSASSMVSRTCSGPRSAAGSPTTGPCWEAW